MERPHTTQVRYLSVLWIRRLTDLLSWLPGLNRTMLFSGDFRRSLCLSLDSLTAFLGWSSSSYIPKPAIAVKSSHSLPSASLLSSLPPGRTFTVVLRPWIIPVTLHHKETISFWQLTPCCPYNIGSGHEGVDILGMGC